MTTTAHRRARRAPGPHRAAPAGERMLDPGVRAEVCEVVGQPVDSAAAQAREAGRFSARHASLMADQWRELVEGVPPGEQAPIEVVRRLVAELRERAPHCTVAQLRAWSRRHRAALPAETQERRHRIAWAGRRVWAEHGKDGMACLQAVLDAPTAPAAQDRLDAFVARLGADGGSGAGASGVPRTEAQLRADVLADLLLAGEVPDDPSFCRDVRGAVSVTVPVRRLLGPLSGPAEGPTAGALHRDAAVLSGYGPISAETARELAAGSTSWHRILTHPVTGAVLDHDRTGCAVPADLRRRLRHRDRTCRFPGCRRRAERCDLDHTVAWRGGGRTAADDLAHLCRHHHLVKDRDGVLGRWPVRRLGPQPQGGILEWTSPAGKTYRTVPDALAALPPGGPEPIPPPGTLAAPQPDPPPF